MTTAIQETQTKAVTEDGGIEAEPSPQQAEVLARYKRRCNHAPVKLKAERKGDELAFVLHTDDATLAKARFSECFGTADDELQAYLLAQGAAGFRDYDGAPDAIREKCANVTLALLGSIRPANAFEAMLCIQMIGTHNVAMEQLRRAILTEQTPEGMDECIARATKASRTFVAQVEALKHYRE